MQTPEPTFIVRTANGYVGRSTLDRDGRILVDSLPRPFAYTWNSAADAAAIAERFNGEVVPCSYPSVGRSV
jgi:hypothetical protein